MIYCVFYLDNELGFPFSIAVTRSKDVPPFGPHIPENAMFPRSDQFAEFLLAKSMHFKPGN